MPRNSNKSVKPFVVPSPQPPVVAPGFGQIVKEGMAFGTGNAIAHTLIRTLFGGPAKVGPISTLNQYDQCMELTKNNREVCEHLR